MGYLPEDELRNLMDISDVSLNIMEDTVGSNVITTSMAMGLAMIVTDVGSIHDYCDESNTIFCNNNVNSIVKAIQKITSSPKDMYNMKTSSIAKSKLLRIESINTWFKNL